MGYTTDFSGQFDLDKPLTEAHREYLNAFNRSRRMARKAEVADTFPDPRRIAAGLPIGPQGGYYVGRADEDHGQRTDESIISYNNPPEGQPALWCQWTPTDDGTAIVWDDGEKFYQYTEWLAYLIENFLKPWGYVLNGEVEWVGEDPQDIGTIYVKDNEVEAVESAVTNPGPSWGKS